MEYTELLELLRNFGVTGERNLIERHIKKKKKNTTKNFTNLRIYL
jgi:hypothetical protein